MYRPLVFLVNANRIFGPFIIGSDPSEVNVKNAEKMNDVVANLQTDSKHRGLSAAQSQGIDIRINCIFWWATELDRFVIWVTSLLVVQICFTVRCVGTWRLSINEDHRHCVIGGQLRPKRFSREDRFSVLSPWTLGVPWFHTEKKSFLWTRISTYKLLFRFLSRDRNVHQ